MLDTELYERYDYDNFDKQHGQPAAIRNLVYDLIGDGKQEILSIGCGNGYLEEPLVAKGHNLTGFELTEKACALAREKGIQAEKVNFMEMDIGSYQKRFDWIVAVDVWEHNTQSDLFLSQIAKLLKDNGKFILKSPNFGHLKFRCNYLVKGSLNTLHQIRMGHTAHYNYKETLEKVNGSPLKISEKYCFTYQPFPAVFKYRDWLLPNLTSLSIILVLSRR